MTSSSSIFRQIQNSGQSIVLESALKPLKPYLIKTDLLEISAKAPYELWLETKEGFESIEDKTFSFEYWRRLSEILSNISGQHFDLKKQPRVSTTLPQGHRYEALLGFNTYEKMSISIRLKRSLDLSLKDFSVSPDWEEEITKSLEKGQNIIISGGTSSGKTSFMNLLAQSIPLQKRIITVEDTYELDLPHLNLVRLLVSRNEASPHVGYPQVIDHILRSRPDIVMAGEISIPGAYPVISLLNTGHKGFLCTIHASSARLAITDAFDAKLRLAGLMIPSVSDYLKKTVDLVIHIIKTETGQRKVAEIWEPQKEEFYTFNEEVPS